MIHPLGMAVITWQHNQIRLLGVGTEQIFRKSA